MIRYDDLLEKVKSRIRQGQSRAAFAANAELILLYWDVGAILHEMQQKQGWGAAVIPRLAVDIHNELPEVKGFSERNLKRMVAFYRAYPLSLKVPRAVAQKASPQKVPQAVAQLENLLGAIPWGHHFLIIERVKDQKQRFWYMRKTIENGWSRDVLTSMIKSELYKREGKVVSNFSDRLPGPQSDLVQQTLKDPYIFDFLTLSDQFQERELETGLIRHLEKFLLELGQGFAFVGRQYHLDVDGEDFYVDLLFYHLKLRCFIVIDLKKGPFKPEYAGKMNFYCNVVDGLLKQDSDQPTIGLVLCQDKKKVLAEYALRGIKKPIGVSQYELTRALPKQLKSSLPTVQQIEEEFSR